MEARQTADFLRWFHRPKAPDAGVMGSFCTALSVGSYLLRHQGAGAVAHLTEVYGRCRQPPQGGRRNTLYVWHTEGRRCRGLPWCAFRHVAFFFFFSFVCFFSRQFFCFSFAWWLGMLSLGDDLFWHGESRRRRDVVVPSPAWFLLVSRKQWHASRRFVFFLFPHNACAIAVCGSGIPAAGR